MCWKYLRNRKTRDKITNQETRKSTNKTNDTIISFNTNKIRIISREKETNRFIVKFCGIYTFETPSAKCGHMRCIYMFTYMIHCTKCNHHLVQLTIGQNWIDYRWNRADARACIPQYIHIYIFLVSVFCCCWDVITVIAHIV